MNNPEFYVAIENGDIEKVVAFVNQGGVYLNENDKKGTPPILYAVKSGNLELLAFLIKSGAYINAFDRLGHKNPLQYAVKNKMVATVQLLIQLGADVNAENKRSCVSALMIAAENDSEEMMEILLKAGATVEALDRDMNTALHYAVLGNKLSSLKKLLEFGANTNVCNQKQETPLGIAATRGNLEAANLLIKAKANINQLTVEGHSALMLAARHNQYQIVQLLLVEGANPFLSNRAHKTALQIAEATKYTESATILRYFTRNINMQTIRGLSPLAYAVYVGDAVYIDSLLSHGADLSYINPVTGDGLLVTAIKVGNADIIEILVTLSPCSASPHPQHYRALSTAMKKNSLQLFEYLAQNLALDADSNNFLQLLIDAVDNEKPDMLIVLLSKITDSKQREQKRLASMVRAAYNGKLLCTTSLFKSSDIKLNLKDTVGNNLFHNAVIRNQHRIVRFLAQYFHVDCFNQHCVTSLHMAVEAGQVDMIDTLASLKADLNAYCDKYKKTPLMLAFTSGQLQAASTLILLGADLSKRNAAGETALHILAYCTSINRDSIKTFVDSFKAKKFNLNSPNSNYDTPLMLAVDFGNFALAQALVDAGADVNAVNLQGQTALAIARENKDANMIALVTPEAKPQVTFFKQASINSVKEEWFSDVPTL